MFAVIKNGGKQYFVQPGDVVKLEKIVADDGAQLEFPAVYVADGANSKVASGGADAVTTVKGKLLKTEKWDKVIVFKKKRRQGYKRKRGHRQTLSFVEILSIA